MNSNQFVHVYDFTAMIDTIVDRRVDSKPKHIPVVRISRGKAGDSASRVTSTLRGIQVPDFIAESYTFNPKEDVYVERLKKQNRDVKIIQWLAENTVIALNGYDAWCANGEFPDSAEAREHYAQELKLARQLVAWLPNGFNLDELANLHFEFAA